MAYKVDINAAPKQLQEMMQMVIEKKVDTAKELKPIAPGALPTKDNEQDYKMYLAGPGTWTHPTMSPNLVLASAEKAMVWWDKESLTWSSYEKQSFKGEPGANGKTIEEFSDTKVYAGTGDQVYFNGDIWKNTSVTLAGENPLTHPQKWGNIPVSLGSKSSLATIDRINESLVKKTLVDRVYDFTIFTTLRRNINLTGGVVTTTNDNNRVSVKVRVFKGDVVTYTLNVGTNNLALALYDFSDNFIEGKRGAGNYASDTFSVNQDGYILFTHFMSVSGAPLVNIVNNQDVITQNTLTVLNKKIVSDIAEVQKRSSVFVDGNETWSILATPNRLYISKDSFLFDTITSETFTQPSGSVHGGASLSKVGSTLHILVSTFDISKSTNGLAYYTYDVITKVLTKQSDLVITGVNARLGTTNQTLFNGNIYASINVLGKVASGSLVQTDDQKSLYLFKLNGSAWDNQGEVIPYDYTWTSKWFKEVAPSTIYRSVPLIAVSNATTVVVNNKLRIIFSTTSMNVYEVETVDFVSYYKVRLLPSVCDTSSPVYLLQYNNEIYYYAQRYSLSDSYFSRESTVFTSDFTKSYNLVDFTKEWEIIPSIKNNNLCLYESSGWNYAELDFQLIVDTLYSRVGSLIKRGVALDFTPSANSKIGDYYELNIEGVYTNFREKIEKTKTPLRTTSRITLYKNERAKVIHEGNNYWRKELITNEVSNAKSTVFNNSSNRNNFGSNTFRIPSITEDKNNKLIAVCDVRYCNSEDYQEIDVGFIRSYDNGLTWTDESIPLKRSPNMGWRMHDPSIVVDKATGRIWVIAKQWEANVDSFNSAYWIANPEKCRLYATYSDDNGKTWQPKIDITSLKDSNVWHISPGCQAGFQDSNGRLIVPIYEAYNDGNHKSSYIYLTSGTTWNKGEIVPTHLGGNECQITEDVNGDYLMIQRASNSGTRRILRLHEGVWSLVDGTSLKGAQVACGLVRYLNTYVHIGVKDLSVRKDIVVKYSYDLINWTELINISNVVTNGYSGVIATNHNFGAIYEDVNNSIAYKSLESLRNILR